MGRVFVATSSKIVISFAVFVGASGFAGSSTAQPATQAPGTSSGTTAANASSAPAALFGAMYGGAAGNHDGALRLSARPSRSPFFSNQAQYKPAAGSRTEYLQQYQSAFAKAYQSAYDAAIKSHKPQGKPQITGKPPGSN